MATIVGGFIVPHAPMYLVMHDVLHNEQQRSCDAAFEKIMSRVHELNADTVIIIGDDHYTLFGPGCIPPFLIGVGDVDGPVEPWLGVPRSRIATNEPLANHIMRHGHRNGVDWAVAKSLTVDHSIYIPWHYGIKPVQGLKTIPIYINSGVDPLVQTRRCQQVGQSIAAAVNSWQSDERVVIYSSGGGAHWPGLGDWDKLNPEWDNELLKILQKGDVEALIAMTDEEVFAVGGNGGWELKNWVCMMGALGACGGETIAYEAVYEWLGSFTYVEMKRAA